MAFNINSFVPQKVEYATGENANGELIWMINQVEGLSIECDGEEVLKKDAQGSTIASISQAKTCTVNFESSLFDMNLIATMNGTEKQIADATNSIIAPKMEIIAITSSNLTEVVLSNSVVNSGTVADPVYKITVATLTNDGALSEKFKVGAAAVTGVCTYTDTTKTLTFAEDNLKVGDRLFVSYEYETVEAVQVVNSAEDFPTAAITKFLIKGFDVCDKTTAIYMYLILPNAKMSTNYTLGFGIEETIPVSMTCSYDYCSIDKELYRLVVAA